MGYEIHFFVDGSVCVYCTSSDVICPLRFQNLEHLQSYCGYLEKYKKDEDPRTQSKYYEWYCRCVFQDSDGELNEEGKKLIMKEMGEFSFSLLSENQQEFLRKEYGYFER